MDLDDLQKLIDMLRDTDITDLQLEKEGSKVRLRREKYLTSIEVPKVVSTVEDSAEISEDKAESKRLVTINSPLVGTFYRAASPEAKVFAELGDRVNKGSVVCIVEAMKLMNEIESDVDGVIAKVLVENAQSVEIGH
jgi:acetyl-CoA carboxylase biotin carboxyl carrier protein